MKTNNNAGSGRQPRLVERLLCWLGWHEWTWKYVRGTPILITSPIPGHAKCKRCGIQHTPGALPPAICPDCGYALKKFDSECYVCADGCGWYHPDDYPELPPLNETAQAIPTTNHEKP